MTFFASRHQGSGIRHQNGSDAETVPAAPSGPPPMADAMLRKMLGVGLSDLQGIADQAGQMLARFDARLTSIEAAQVEILARLEYLAVRGKNGDKH